jgi:hypothetical protein
MLCYFSLCCVKLCCVVLLCYAVLCYAMLCYATLRYVTLRYVMLCYVTTNMSFIQTYSAFHYYIVILNSTFIFSKRGNRLKTECLGHPVCNSCYRPNQLNEVYFSFMWQRPLFETCSLFIIFCVINRLPCETWRVCTVPLTLLKYYSEAHNICSSRESIRLPSKSRPLCTMAPPMISVRCLM